MKVLKITTWYPNPFLPLLGSFVNDQAKALRDENIDVGVLFVDMGIHHFSSKISNFSNKSTFQIEEGIPTFRYQGLFLPKWTTFIFDRWVKYFDILYQNYVLKNGTPDVLHAHHYQAGYAAFFLSKKYNIPFVITEHATVFLHSELKGTQKYIATTAFNNADKIIAVSSGLKKAIQKYTTNEVMVIPNLIDTSIFQISLKEKTYNNKKTKLIAIGDLIKRKRFDLIIEAISKMSADQKENIELKILGEGSERQTLETLISKHHLSNQVFLLGEKKKEEVAKHLKQSDTFILSSDFETFGIVLIEAIACGIPVIATRCQGPEDIVNKNNGILIPLNDANALKSAIEKMQSTLTNYDASEMRTEIKNKYDKTVIVNKLLQTYEAFLA